MKLSVLMAALSSRLELRVEVTNSIRNQIKNQGGVEFIILEDEGEMTSGKKRNLLREMSRGKYIVFVDDDDLVRPNYVTKLLDAIKSHPESDVITFLVERLGDDRPREILDMSCYGVEEKIKISGGRLAFWPNPLCAWRRELALKIPFCEEIGYNDDIFWYTPLFKSGLVKNIYKIDSILYIYKFRRVGSLNQRINIRNKTYEWAGTGIEYFWDEDEIVRAEKNIDLCGKEEYIRVINSKYYKYNTYRKDLKPLCVVKAK